MASKIFEKVGARRPKMSSFDLSHDKKLSFNMGDLIPCYLQEVLPGDRFSTSTECMIRLAPMIAPVMHRVNATVHYFFVPNRIIWKGWEDFITGGVDGLSAPPMPHMNLDLDWNVGGLGDYMGIPPIAAGYPSGSEENCPISQLPFRAYQKIYNEYYRDETLDAPVEIDPDDWTVPLYADELGVLRKRSWNKDYFTSALPFTQRGARVELPFETLAESSDITYLAQGILTDGAGNPINSATGINSNAINGGIQSSPANTPANIRNIDEITGIGGVDINDFRVAHRLQKWLEAQARGGYRLIETILTHFGVKSSDARLQRPEYLGGATQPVIISEVLNTTGTEDAPQGQMSGHGISAGRTNSFSKRFEEHGWVIGIISVMPQTAYYQGVNKMFNRVDKLDYYWPEFAHLGEQEVRNSEIWLNPAGFNSSARATFGYQQRYAEYKYAQDTVHGDFRTSLEFYHMARKFDTQPLLNEEFVQADPTHRIFAVDDDDPSVHKLWAHIFNNVRADRPMPHFGIPTI